jgi:hypothetical protein
MYPWESNQGEGVYAFDLSSNSKVKRCGSPEKARLEKVLSRCRPEIQFVAHSS